MVLLRVNADIQGIYAEVHCGNADIRLEYAEVHN